MLNKKFIPTRLIDPAGREKITIIEQDVWARSRVGSILVNFLGLLGALLWLALRRKLTRAEYAVRLRLVMERLGGLWIKAGQLLALRRDIFSAELCTELSKLQDRAFGFTFDRAKQIIEEEMGGPSEQFFEQIEEMPFAAASIGQMHMALLRREGIWVALKVQRPHAPQVLGRDLAVIRFAVRLLRFFSILPHLRWEEMLGELRQIMLEELDYQFEAAAMRRMRRSLRPHGIYVPKTFPRYCKRRILASEFIAGVLMADYIKVVHSAPAQVKDWCAENNVDPRRVARCLYLSHLRQLFEDNLFHGDLHPGNIILLRDSRVAFIDFGTVGFMDAEFQKQFGLFVEALAARDYAKAVDLMLLLSGSIPVVDLNELRAKCVQRLRAWDIRNHTPGIPYREKSASTIMGDLAAIMYHYKITAEWAFLRIDRTHATLDASLMHLAPDINYTRLMAEYFRQSQRRSVRLAAGEETLFHFVSDVRKAVLAAPGRIYEFMLFQSPIVRRHAMLFQGSMTKISYFLAVIFSRLALFLFFSGLLFLLTFLHQHYPDRIEPWTGGRESAITRAFPPLAYEVWLLLLVVDFYLCYTFFKLKKRFQRKDIIIPDTYVSA